MSWRRFFSRGHNDRECARELESYLEIETQENIGRGMPAGEARRAACVKLGNPTLILEEIYHMNTLAFFESLWQDLRYSLRALAKNTAFSSVVIASLALGIGANTAIFSLIDAALLKMLPVRNPDQLVQFTTMTPNVGVNDSFSYPELNAFRRSKILSGMLAFRKLHNIDLEINGESSVAQGQVVSGDYFQTLGVSAILGRTITPEDEKLPGQDVAVIGYDYWRQRFALDPNIVGRKIVINNALFMIVGVTPPEFFGLQPGERIDVSLPLPAMSRVNSGFAASGSPYDVLCAPFRNWLYVMGRLKPGVTKERALAELEPVFRQSMREAAQRLAGLPFDSPVAQRSLLDTRPQLQAGGKGLAVLRERFSKPLWTIMAVVVLLLLVTCANVGNLLLARGTARRKEIAVRLTVGAGRRRLIRQLIAEGVLLSIGGGTLGLLLAWCASQWLLLLMSHSRVPISLSVQPDATVLIFTLGASLAAALLFSILPAVRAVRLELSLALLQSTRAMGKSVGRSRLAKVLVVSQIAASLIMLTGAALLVRSLANLKDFYPGFNKQNVLLVSIDPGVVGYHEDRLIVALYERLLDGFKTIPGVRNVSFSVHSPLSQSYSYNPIDVEGVKPRPGQEMLPVGIEPVGPGYFRTMSAPVLLGRDFNARDRAGAPKVAVINETLARFYFGSANPLGRRLKMPGYRGDPSYLEIVAVVKDAKYHDLREQPSPMAYISLLQYPESGITFEIRTAVNPTNVASAALRALKSIDSRIPIFAVKTLTEQVDDSLIEERLVASLSSAFGVLAAILACIGLYGLMAYGVNRRTNEIGVRIALGAKRRQILGMVLSETLVLVSIGVGMGIPAAAGASRLIRNQLFGLQPADPVVILFATLLMIGVALVAGYLPARRAARVDPMIALRYE